MRDSLRRMRRPAPLAAIASSVCWLACAEIAGFGPERELTDPASIDSGGAGGHDSATDADAAIDSGRDSPTEAEAAATDAGADTGDAASEDASADAELDATIDADVPDAEAGLSDAADEVEAEAEAQAPVGCAGGAVQWSKRFGDPAADFSGSAVSDRQAGLYVAGVFAGQLDLGGGPITSAGGLDLFLARLDASGRQIWGKRFGDALDQSHELRLVTTEDGGVLFAGAASGTVDFGDGLRTLDLEDAFVARYASDGRHLWTRLLSGPGRQAVHGIALTPDGDALFLAGVFEQRMSVDSTEVVSAGSHDAFLIKLDAATGSRLWSRSFGGANGDTGHAVEVSPSGRVAFGGATRSPIDLGLGSLGPTDFNDAFVAYYEPDMTPIWTRRLGGVGEQDLRRIALDPVTGDLFLFGALFFGSMDVGTGPISAQYGSFLARLAAADGRGLAARAVPALNLPSSLFAAGGGDVLVAGGFSGTTTFGAGAINSAGEQDSVVALLDSSLAPRWSLRVGGAGTDNVHSLALDQAGLFAFGYFRQTLAIEDCEPLQSAGDADLLLLRLSPPTP
jgi:outer membrane protein assembly factor BamB